MVVGPGKSEATTLEEAIERVRPRGRIFVRAGVHRHRASIKVSKPFTLVGEGMTRSVLHFSGMSDDCLVVNRPGSWSFEGCSFLGEFKSGKVGDIVQCGKKARLALRDCFVGGGRGREDRTSTEGGAVRAYGGGIVDVKNCHLAVSWFGALAHGGGKVTLERSSIYGTTLGLCAIDGSVDAKSVVVAESRRRGISSWAEDSRVRCDRCSFDVTGLIAAYVQSGRLELTRCSLSRAFDGILTESGSEVVASGRLIEKHDYNGAEIAGAAQLTRNRIRDNGDHGISFDAKATGTVTGNHVTDNGGHGIICDPKSRVTMRGNRASDNGGADVFDYPASIAYVREQITVFAKSGYYDDKSLRAEADSLVADELDDRDDMRTTMRALAATLIKRQRASEKTWRSLTKSSARLCVRRPHQGGHPRGAECRRDDVRWLGRSGDAGKEEQACVPRRCVFHPRISSRRSPAPASCLPSAPSGGPAAMPPPRPSAVRSARPSNATGSSPTGMVMPGVASTQMSTRGRSAASPRRRRRSPPDRFQAPSSVTATMQFKQTDCGSHTGVSPNAGRP